MKGEKKMNKDIDELKKENASAEPIAGDDENASVDKETATKAADEATSQDTEEETEADKTADKTDESKIFKKKAKPDKNKEKIDELEDKVKRQLAEFDNFRKRSELEKSSRFEMGARSVVEKILPTIDNFERGLQTVPEDQKESPFVDGMNRIYKQLLTELESIGVKPIEAVGQPFDPNLHNAVMQEENEELESGTVAKELQKGYLYKDTVVRHSMVSVVQ